VKPKVYLGDLRHRYLGVLASDTMPLGIAYMKAVMDRDLDVAESQLFAYPEPLLAAIQASPPAILMLSNYMWNEQLSLHVARVAKAVNPQTLVVLGGPNLFDDAERQVEYVRRHPEIDVYVLGEGDFLATELAQMFFDSGASVERFTAASLPSSIYRRADGEVVRNPVRARQRGLDEIPSPWLTGVLDEFFDGRLAPLWETNRGCPFTCTFCVQGTSYYTPVANFASERLREELHYMGRRIRERSPAMGTLRIADANWGMYQRDPLLSEHIAEVQAAYRWPTYIDATTGKNRPDRIIASMEKVGGALMFWQAVQSVDADVLDNVRRKNIKLESYEKLQVYMRGRGLKSSADLILGLPGDTLDSHVRGILRLVESGAMKLNNFQGMMLKGTELERLESRRRHGLVTRFRLIAKSFGIYDEVPVFEHDEIVVATDTMSFADYLTARTYHFACALFMNHARLEPLFDLGVRLGVSRSNLYSGFVRALEADTGQLRGLLDRFLAESRAELFVSVAELQAHYARPENLAHLKAGTVGENLIAKYLALACLHLWKPICQTAVGVARQLFLSRPEACEIVNLGLLMDDLEMWLLHKYATGQTKEALVDDVTGMFHFDIDRWVEDAFPSNSDAYRFASPTGVVFRFSEDKRMEVAAAVDTWGLTVHGSSMLMKRLRIGGLERDLSLVAAGDMRAPSMV